LSELYTVTVGYLEKHRKEEKPAFHLRRWWTWREAEALGDKLPEAIAAEVRRLLPILRDTW